MRALSLALLTLLPVGALAQNQITITIPGSVDGTTSLGPDDCARVLPANWTNNSASTLRCEELLFWLTTSSSCGNRPSSSDAIVESDLQPDQQSGTVDLAVSQLPAFTSGTEPLTCPQPDLEETWRLCASYRTAPGLTSDACIDTNMFYVKVAQPPVIEFDTRAPAAPVFDSVTPLDGEAAVSLSAGSDALFVDVTATAEGHPTRTLTMDARTANGRLSPLENGVEYTVVATARDQAGNVSGESEPQTVTPLPTAGFWQRYKEAGGEETGGCSHAGGGALAFVSLLSLARVIRRKRS